MSKAVFVDELYAAMNGISEETYKHNKSLPIEQKVKLPAHELISALYITKESKYE